MLILESTGTQNEGKCLRTMETWDPYVNALVIIYKRTFLISGSSSSEMNKTDGHSSFCYYLQIWNMDNGQFVERLMGHTNGGVYSMLLDNKSGLLLSGSRDGELKVWNVESRE